MSGPYFKVFHVSCHNDDDKCTTVQAYVMTESLRTTQIQYDGEAMGHTAAPAT